MCILYYNASICVYMYSMYQYYIHVNVYFANCFSIMGVYVYLILLLLWVFMHTLYYYYGCLCVSYITASTCIGVNLVTVRTLAILSQYLVYGHKTPVRFFNEKNIKIFSIWPTFEFRGRYFIISIHLCRAVTTGNIELLFRCIHMWFHRRVFTSVKFTFNCQIT